MSISLGLNSDPLTGALAPKKPHKSAGLAFLLSLIIPGSGQMYCGMPRGFTILGVWVVSVLLTAFGATGAKGNGIVVGLVIWIFAFLDAYFTALEIDAGLDLEIDGQNPRVAATLNLLTAGLGYFYLGERAKGIILFLVANALKIVVGATSGYWQGVASLVSLVVGALMARDAWRIAHRQVREALGDQPELPISSSDRASRLPFYVPVGLATIATAGFLAIVVFGLAVSAVRGPMHKRVAEATPGSEHHVAPQPFGVASTSHLAGDTLLRVVENVQRLEKKPAFAGNDVAELQNSVGNLSALLEGENLDGADMAVAYYYRAHARRLLNEIHGRSHEGFDSSLAQQSLQDFDQVIASRANVYVAEVNARSAEYWAASVALNQLRSRTLAYSYWEKCAAQGGQDCANILATIRNADAPKAENSGGAGLAH